MYVVLLTGGLASGKDTVCAYLEELGASTLDLDVIAKEEQENSLVLEQLEEAFGDDIVDDFGSLNRRLLAERAFASREAADMLNAICWPPVQDRVADYILGSSCQPMNRPGLLVIQIPLLAEAPALLDLKDEVISVVAPEALRFERAVVRGMKPEDARNRLDLQVSDDKRIAISDTVFDNSGSVENLRQQVKDWYNERSSARLF
ncbi:MAG: dephospho-CoA kinase [Coriobacteriales bacterium]|nr:dephospho-CoA kinase [Coriobacteriales bacterium]